MILIRININPININPSCPVIKESILLVSEPLTCIINLSIQHGIVPDEMKIARVIPFFKI